VVRKSGEVERERKSLEEKSVEETGVVVRVRREEREWRFWRWVDIVAEREFGGAIVIEDGKSESHGEEDKM
jgi:hypothetical protein